jgi:hypothetical protein
LTTSTNYKVEALLPRVTPLEFDGSDVDLPEFEQDKEYGLWIKLRPDESNERMMKMFEVILHFVPEHLRNRVALVHRFEVDGDNIEQTVGWKYVAAPSSTGGEPDGS